MATTAQDVGLADELLESLALIRRHTRRLVGRPSPLQSLSLAQGEVVRLVHRQPGISVAAAAAELGVAPNTVSTLVRALIDAGMLRRVADDGDRRIARLHLTAQARRRVERWRDARAGVVSAALAELGDADRAALVGALPALARLAARLRPEET